MAKTFKTIVTFSVLITLMISFQSNAFAKDRFPRDKSRNVLSFADILEPILPSVVRVGRISANDEGKPQVMNFVRGGVEGGARPKGPPPPPPPEAPAPLLSQRLPLVDEGCDGYGLALGLFSFCATVRRRSRTSRRAPSDRACRARFRAGGAGGAAAGTAR